MKVADGRFTTNTSRWFCCLTIHAGYDVTPSKENQRNFDAIESPVVKYQAVDDANEPGHRGQFFEHFKRDCQAKEVVQLKVGAQVLLLKNLDTNAGLCNGSRGVVIDFVKCAVALCWFEGCL